jgi:hypothetical protein
MFGVNAHHYALIVELMSMTICQNKVPKIPALVNALNLTDLTRLNTLPTTRTKSNKKGKEFQSSFAVYLNDTKRVECLALK